MSLVPELSLLLSMLEVVAPQDLSAGLARLLSWEVDSFDWLTWERLDWLMFDVFCCSLIIIEFCFRSFRMAPEVSVTLLLYCMTVPASEELNVFPGKFFASPCVCIVWFPWLDVILCTLGIVVLVWFC